MVRINRLTPLFALALLATTLAMPTGVASAATATWGWVVARNPTAGAYTPGPKDQGNSAGLSNSVDRLSRGQYAVDFPGINNGYGGHVTVTALGSAPRYCTTGGWATPTVSDISVLVSCYGFDGASANSAFSVNYVANGYNTGTMSYVWANRPTDTDYTPDLTYQFSRGGAITIHRTGSGRYLVTLPGMSPSHGNIEITGYGDAYCLIGETSSDGSSLVVGVRCPDGDTQFDLLYSRNVGLTGVPGRNAAYLYATQPSSASYTPVAAYRYSSAGTNPNVKRTAVGTYVATLRGAPKGGAAQVTSAGVDGGGHFCQLTSIRTTGTPQKIGVKCFLLDGTPADSRFMLSYTK